MPKQSNQLTASSISQFSVNSGKSKAGTVWILYKTNGKLSSSDVQSYKAKTTLIKTDKKSKKPISDVNEEQLKQAINELASAKDSVFSLDAWVKVSFYIASLFNPSEEDRPKVEAAVLRARWSIIVCDNAKLVLNDRGMAAMHNPHWNSYGYVFPLRPDLGLMLGRGPFNKPVIWINDRWHIIIPELHLNSKQIKSLNLAACQQSKSEIYASKRAILEDLSKHFGSEEQKESPDIFENASLLGLSEKKRKEDQKLMQKLLEGYNEPLESVSSQTFLKI